MGPRLTDSLEFHGRALMLRAQRQQLLAGNIANADTPGYRARDFDFAAALRDATSASGSGRGLGGAATPRLRDALAAQTNLDRNNVDMDRERASFAHNAVQYESTLRFVNSSIRTALDAMKSHTSG
jgi:flagellar basal-body rod protein FlgB